MTTSIKVVHANHTEDFEWLSACCGRTAVDEIEEMCSGCNDWIMSWICSECEYEGEELSEADK